LDNRFYLQALGVTGLFIILMILFWSATERPANEAAVQNANSTRTSIAMTGSYLLQPRTGTPGLLTMTSTPVPQTGVPSQTSAPLLVPSVTSTSLLSQFSTLTAPVASSITPLPTLTAVAPVPVFTSTASGELGTRTAPLVPVSTTPTVVHQSPSTLQDPAEFTRWYFARVWNERDYQNLWDNYLTASYKTNVGSGLFEDYVWWWNSVARVDVNSAEVLQNNGRDALVRVHLTFHMTDGRVVENQIYEYDLLFDPSRNTWMFDAS
jgi:hypothetical protein